VELEAGETIIHKGDPGRAVYFILAGEVEVRLQAADGRHLALCQLGPGEYFGELSVLRHEPVSADVASITPVRLLSYPAESFPTALTECAPLRERLLGRLAQDLQRSTTDAWDLFKREQALADLARADGVEDSMIVASPQMRTIRKKLVASGDSRESMLITGAPGTGRTLAARLVHRSSGDSDRSLIIVDCEELPADGAYAALFGYCVDDDPREDTGCFGALHLAHGGDLILRNLGALEAQEQQELARYLRRWQQGEVTSFPLVRVIVELAAKCSAGDEIRADHIFSSLGEEEPIGLSLGQPPAIVRFLDSGGLNFLRGVTLVSFLAAIALCLSAGTTGAGQFANGLIWSAWEPAVFALFLLAGALWCTVCPLSTVGRLAKRIINLEKPPPSWLNGMFVASLPVVGFFAILWVEWVFHMTERPFGSGLLLLGLILSSVVLCMLYEREVWCRYVCPLGQLAVVLAPAAPLSLAVDRKICASTCTTHDCYRGTDKAPGCTVFRHPLTTDEAHHCKLCGDCMRSCPHQSPGLYLRPPGQGASRLGESGSYPAGFAVSLLLLAPLFLAVETTEFMKQPVVLTAFGIGSIVIGLLLAWRLPYLLGTQGENQAAAQRVAAAFAVLAWGPLMAVQFRNIPLLGDLYVRSASAAAGLGPFSEGVTLLTLACIGIVTLAGVASALILWRTRKRSETELAPIARPAWHGVRVAWLVSLGVSLALVL
jgi:polyferredoxin